MILKKPTWMIIAATCVASGLGAGAAPTDTTESAAPEEEKALIEPLSIKLSSRDPTIELLSDIVHVNPYR